MPHDALALVLFRAIPYDYALPQGNRGLATCKLERSPDMTRDDARLRNESSLGSTCSGRAACPVCGGTVTEIRAKLVCTNCHTICETCCDGGRAT